jgi:hypothetical protein
MVHKDGGGAFDSVGWFQCQHAWLRLSNEEWCSHPDNTARTRIYIWRKTTFQLSYARTDVLLHLQHLNAVTTINTLYHTTFSLSSTWGLLDHWHTRMICILNQHRYRSRLGVRFLPFRPTLLSFLSQALTSPRGTLTRSISKNRKKFLPPL